MTEQKGFALEGVAFSYNGVPALRNLELTLSPGRFYGVVGPNGCGKTTFLDILTGGKRPEAGQVDFRGVPVSSYRRRELARWIALVPQDFAIGFAFTVQEVVLMGRHPYMKRFAPRSEEDLRIVTRAMEAIGISRFKQRYVNELSGGEKQRVVVARALAQQTPFLLFDEATSNLDVRHTMQIFNVARRLVKERQHTVIAVIHNLDLAAAYCDEIVFMREGEIVAKGPTANVLTPGIIKEVFGVECRVGINPFGNTRQVSYRYWS